MKLSKNTECTPTCTPPPPHTHTHAAHTHSTHTHLNPKPWVLKRSPGFTHESGDVQFCLCSTSANLSDQSNGPLATSTWWTQFCLCSTSANLSDQSNGPLATSTWWTQHSSRLATGYMSSGNIPAGRRNVTCWPSPRPKKEVQELFSVFCLQPRSVSVCSAQICCSVTECV